MHSLKSLSRLAVPAVAAVLATPLIATPAMARQDPAQTQVGFSVSTNQLNLAQGAAAKPLKFTLRNGPAAPAQDVVVRIGADQLDGAFTADLPGSDEGCTIADAVATCTLKELAPNASHVYTVGIRAAAGAKRGSLAMIRATLHAANAPEKSVWTELQVQEPGTDLFIGDIPDMNLAPGASASLPIVVGNTGNTEPDVMNIVIYTSEYLEAPNEYSNCISENQTLTCSFSAPSPGEFFKIDPATPLKIKLAATAPGPIDLGGEATVLPFMMEDADRVQGRSGPEMRLIPLRNARSIPAKDLNEYDNTARFVVHVPKTAADSVAVGATVTGTVGETQTVTVGVRNDGPADIMPPSDKWASSADVTLPAGLRVLTVPRTCRPLKGDKADWAQLGNADGLVYRCTSPDQIKVHKAYSLAFKVEITGEAEGAGVIKIDGGVQDDKSDNDSAPITLTIGAGGAGGGLPITGAKAGMAASGGLMMVLGGAATFWMARRRRVVTVIVD